MKLDAKTIDYILAVVKVADLVKIDSVIIEPDRVRGKLEDNSVILLHTSNVPKMPFGSIGMTRLDVFSSRYELAKMCDDFKMEVETSEDKTSKEMFARSIVMKGKGIKVDYRCANPAVIKVYKTINDTVCFAVKMSAEAVVLMSKAQSAMGGEVVSLVSDENDGITFEMVDITGDKMSYKFSDKIKVLDEDRTADFCFSYPLKMLLPLLKHVADHEIEITSRGVIKLNVFGFDVYVLPRS